MLRIWVIFDLAWTLIFSLFIISLKTPGIGPESMNLKTVSKLELHCGK